MRQILASRNRHLLRQYASAKTLLAFDFDGTLAPIVSDPDRAAMRQSTRRLLAKVSALYPCIVISGRARSDVLRRLEGSGVKQVIGNHGVEPWGATRRKEEAVARLVPGLEQTLQPFRGVVVENKRFTLAVHYRHEPRKQKARAAIMDAARQMSAVRIVGGKQVVNILPAGSPDKGVALERTLRKLHCDQAVYVGDDVTDEDVFGLANRGRLLAIRVGLNRDSLAPYYIPTQGDIDFLLQALIELRLPRKAREPGHSPLPLPRTSAARRSWPPC